MTSLNQRRLNVFLVTVGLQRHQTNTDGFQTLVYNAVTCKTNTATTIMNAIHITINHKSIIVKQHNFWQQKIKFYIKLKVQKFATYVNSTVYKFGFRSFR